MELSNDQLLHIFFEIHNGRGNHGSFLTAFAIAILAADWENLAILRPAVIQIIAKYNLDKYLDTLSSSAQLA